MIIQLILAPALVLAGMWLFWFDGILRIKMLMHVHHQRWWYLMTVDLDAPSIHPRHNTMREQYAEMVRPGSDYRKLGAD